MNIDWTSLGLVSVVTVVATVLIVSVVSGGALMLDRAHARAEAGSDGAAAVSYTHLTLPTNREV